MLWWCKVTLLILLSPKMDKDKYDDRGIGSISPPPFKKESFLFIPFMGKWCQPPVI